MKSYIKALMLTGVLTGATACTDLDVPITVDLPEFPDSEIASFGEYSKCYYYIRNEAWVGRNFWETVFMSGDEAMGVSFAGNYFDNGRRVYYAQHRFRPDHTSGGQEGPLMEGMTMCNLVMKQYENPADPTDVAHLAPLRAARAFYMFLFMDLYGDAPIQDHVIQTDQGELDFDRSPRAKVAEFIEKELLEIMPDLNEASDIYTYGTPNKWMAKALLAKLYLNWGVYTNDITTVDANTPNPKLNDCIQICDDIINSGLFEVGDGYRKKFFPDNGYQIKDFIYAVPFDPLKYGNGYWGGWQPNRDWDFRSIGLFNEGGTWGWYPGETPSGTYVMTPEAVDRFCLEGDERNDMVAVGQHYMFDKNFNKTDTKLTLGSGRGKRNVVYTKEIEWSNIDEFDVGPESSPANLLKGARLYKYPPKKEDYELGKWDKKGLQGNDFPVFRFADILLMKAECLIKGGTPTLGHTAADLINMVRDCAHAPHFTGTPTLKDLMDERGRELIMEMWRRNDLIRNGMFEDDWGYKHVVNPSAKTNKNLRLFPLSNGTMATHTNWQQNPGY